MRERNGVRTEHATRRLAVPVTALSLVAGLALVATPSSAVPASPPTDSVATAGPATALPSHGAGRTAPAAAVGTDVNEIGLARVPDGQAPTPPQDVPVVAELGQRATAGYSLVGVTWQAGTAPADVQVQVRTHGGAGWSSWKDLSFEPSEGPAPAEDVTAPDGTEPLWVGDADGVQARI